MYLIHVQLPILIQLLYKLHRYIDIFTVVGPHEFVAPKVVVERLKVLL
jgi:hypothetical protein